MPPLVNIGLERIEDCWQEAEDLLYAEYVEIEEKRKFAPDWNSLRVLNDAGRFQVLIARSEDGKMVGYLTWMIDFDIESKGTLIANQATWYVKPGFPWAASKLFDEARRLWRKAGVEFAYLHHTNKGRGAKLGKFFERKGAELLGFNYVLTVKAKP